MTPTSNRREILKVTLLLKYPKKLRKLNRVQILRRFKSRSTERIYLNVGMPVNPIMPTVCVRIVIMPKAGPRKPLTAVIQIEFFMPRVSARTATYLSTTNAREIPRKR